MTAANGNAEIDPEAVRRFAERRARQVERYAEPAMIAILIGVTQRQGLAFDSSVVASKAFEVAGAMARKLGDVP